MDGSFISSLSLGASQIVKTPFAMPQQAIFHKHAAQKQVLPMRIQNTIKTLIHPTLEALQGFKT